MTFRPDRLNMQDPAALNTMIVSQDIRGWAGWPCDVLALACEILVEHYRCMTLIGYGSYDTESYKPRSTKIFDEYFQTLQYQDAVEYEESDVTGARAELRADEEGYWWVRYMSPFGDRISEVHDDENSARERYRELALRVTE